MSLSERTGPYFGGRSWTDFELPWLKAAAAAEVTAAVYFSCFGFGRCARSSTAANISNSDGGSRALSEW